MNDAVQREILDGGDGAPGGPVRRRHVIYVSGYDPRGARSFFDMLHRTCERFCRLWPITATLHAADLESEDCARWELDLRGKDWQVATRYDFVRMENFIRRDLAQPTLRQLLRGLAWYADDVFSGAQFRIFDAAWRFALHLLYFQLLVAAWTAAALAVALMVGYLLADDLGVPLAASIIIAIGGGTAVIFALRKLAERWRVVQIASCWSTLRRFGRGAPTWIDGIVEIGARRVVAAAHAGTGDEIALVGHSTGGAIACAIMARALELDAELGRRGPRVVLLTLGSVMPAVALHPAASKMRGIVSRLATAHSIVWIDCQSRKDVMCFANFDPVGGIGVQPAAARPNPLLWRISFKEMIAPENYGRFRWSHFRVHYQYIMAGDRAAPYDYVLLVGGPMPIAEWPQRDHEFFAALRGAAPVAYEPVAYERGRCDTVTGAVP